MIKARSFVYLAFRLPAKKPGYHHSSCLATDRIFRRVEEGVVDSAAGQVDPAVLDAVDDDLERHVQADDGVQRLNLVKRLRLMTRPRKP